MGIRDVPGQFSGRQVRTLQGHLHNQAPLLQFKSSRRAVAEVSLSESGPLVLHALTAHILGTYHPEASITVTVRIHRCNRLYRTIIHGVGTRTAGGDQPA